MRLYVMRRPEWWLYVVATAAWFVLLARHGSPETLSPHTVAGHHASGVATSRAGDTDFVGLVADGLHHWSLMVLAMMLPLVAPQARLVALRSLWLRRHRSAVIFVTGYLALWFVTGVGIFVALAVVGVTTAPVWVAPALLVLAALWHVAPQRSRVVRRCGSLRLREADGPAADRNCALLGVRAGARCVFSCGVVMLAMALHLGSVTGVVLMAAVLAVELRERADGPDPATRAGHPRGAVALVAMAGLVALPTLLS